MQGVIDFVFMVRPYAGGLLCIAGAVLAIIGTIGTLRFPDFYTRLHAASVTDTAASTLLIAGMMILSPHWLVTAKLGAMWLFLFFTGPTASHAVANAAYTADLQPVIGPVGTTDAEGEDA